MFIDSTELLLGAIGVASSIYDPWVGDLFAPVFVTLARAAGVTSLFLCAGLGLLSLAARGELDADPTNIAVTFFAAGAAAPIIARGAWSLIDIGTMFNDLMYESYMPVTRGSLPGGVANRQNSMQPCNVDSIGVRMFVLWTIAVFMKLMSHNVSFHKLSPYARDLFRAIGHNIDKMFHGQVVYGTTQRERWKWGIQSWSARLKALLNFGVLDALGVGFLILQAFATLGDGLLLAVGSLSISLAVAAHVNTLRNDRGNRGNPNFRIVLKEEPLRHGVEDFICSPTCNYKINDRSHVTGRLSSENTKAYLDIMPNVRRTSLGARGQNINHYCDKCLELFLNGCCR